MREQPLSTRVFSESSAVHRQAERRPFMVVFLKAQLPKDSYVEYLGRLSFVYEALERCDDALQDDPIVGRMHAPELHRSKAIAADLLSLGGPDRRSRATYSNAVRAYVERIEYVERELPAAFAAHQWLRYLGNVLAQPVLLRIMERAYGLTGEGTEFYRYDDIPDARAYVREYHERMNSMPLDGATADAVVDEANRAWRLQIDLTDELASDLGIAGPDEEETERVLQELAAHHP
jgi:heme oxygenase